MHFNTVTDFMVVYCMYTIMFAYAYIRRSTETERDMTPAHAPRDALLINVPSTGIATNGVKDPGTHTCNDMLDACNNEYEMQTIMYILLLILLLYQQCL